MIRMDRYTLKQAKESLLICDHMNIDNEWLIARIEQLESDNFKLKESNCILIKEMEFLRDYRIHDTKVTSLCSEALKQVYKIMEGGEG
jgi:hypothetical protein